MTDQLPAPGDPIMQRLQRAFADEEPALELAAVLQRAARYQAGQPRVAEEPSASGHGLTAVDLTAARRQDPAAVSRVYSAYGPALFRFFMAAVGDRRQAEDLTGTTFVSAIEGLAGFGGPVEALGGWLFQIARHDLYDHQRRQARSRAEVLEDDLDPAAGAAGAVGPQAPSNDTATQTRPALPAVLDYGAVSSAMGPRLLWRLGDIGERATDVSLGRLSPRQREVLALLGRGWSDAQIGRELYISPHTVRIQVQNILQKLALPSRLEAVIFASQRGATSVAEHSQALAIGPLEDARVLAAMRQLPADQREVLLLGMAAGLSAAEVAAVLGTTTGAVKALQHRGRARLARMLGRQDPEAPDDRPEPLPD
jgi:RNA polymerase sigma factor (sigma-70 family)